ncbi:MAG: methyltransferase domain-containing protein [Candidatus Lokiarchaeota archaeon]|nr:methyltransferase domain-containing protein [Candidatus Lokiarchaeota archaeon]MBD3339755.1 methyltransferase domain-containing protein [Candidatus Lokiarchaeota archaeon]
MKNKTFYEKHINFAQRNRSEYYISPGIKCKFDLIIENVGSSRTFSNALDLGSSGNSILYFIDNIKHKSYFDIALLPLRQYRRFKLFSGDRVEKVDNSHPLCGDITKLPYRDTSFDFISALDVLEHVKDHKIAISEISRVLKKGAIGIITVPHRMKYYTGQDRLIGHYRRYEIEELIEILEKSNLKVLNVFGVYGRLMRVADIQSSDPQKVEKTISNLRKMFISNLTFRKVWSIIVFFISKIMKMDAKYTPIKQIMNIAILFKK